MLMTLIALPTLTPPALWPSPLLHAHPPPHNTPRCTPRHTSSVSTHRTRVCAGGGGAPALLLLPLRIGAQVVRRAQGPTHASTSTRGYIERPPHPTFLAGCPTRGLASGRWERRSPTTAVVFGVCWLWAMPTPHPPPSRPPDSAPAHVRVQGGCTGLRGCSQGRVGRGAQRKRRGGRARPRFLSAAGPLPASWAGGRQGGLAGSGALPRCVRAREGWVGGAHPLGGWAG